MCKSLLFKSLCLSFLLLLSSCFHNNVIFDKNIYSQGKMAYIVIGASNNAPPAINRITFKNKKTKKETELNVNGTHSFMIPAGDYELTEFRLSIGSSYLNFHGYQIEGGFSVSEGEAVYLGHIVFNLTGGFPNNYNPHRSYGQIKYTTDVINSFDAFSKEKFETECDKQLVPRIMTWNKIEK